MKSTIRLSIALLAMSAIANVFAQGTVPAPIEPTARTFDVGRITVTALLDAQNVLPNDGKVFGVGVGSEAVAAVLGAHGAPTDRITLSVGGLLLKSGTHTVLIDTGFGPSRNGQLIASLGKSGHQPADIDTVLITHVHRDHIGGLVTADGAPAFPNAVVRISAPDWSFLESQPPMQALVKVIGPHVKTFNPGEEVVPGVTSVAIKGHTPGHVGYLIASGNARLLDIGDTAHSSIVSLAKPEWAIGFDTDRETGEVSRRETLAKLAQDHTLIFAPHFPYPGIGHVVADGDHFIWQPL